MTNNNDNDEEAMASPVSTKSCIGGDATAVAGESASLPFVSELIACLPDNATLGDVAAACDGFPHNDVVWRPALLVMEAHLTIARVSTAPRSMTPSDGNPTPDDATLNNPTPDDRTTDDATPDVGEHLACAACIIKSLLEVAVKLRKKQEAQAQQTEADSPQPAPICEFDEVVAAALHLRSEVYHVAVRHGIFVRVCTWEREIHGCSPDDAVVQRTGIYWAGDGNRRTEVVQEATGAPTPVTAVLKKLRAAAVELHQAAARQAEAARSASSTAPRTPPAEVPVQKHHVSPYLRFDMPSVLPCELSQGPITCGRAPLQALKGIKFSWPLPAKIQRLFRVTQWDAPVFDSKAHAAAQCIAASLGELAEKHTHADRQGSDERRRKRARSPSPVQGAAQNVAGDELNISSGVDGPSEHSDMAAIFAQLDEINAGIRRLDARYEVKALVAEVNAALTAYCDALLKTISFPKPHRELLRLVFIDSMNRGEGEPASDCRSVYVSGRCPLRAALSAGWATANGEIRPCPECGEVGQCVTQSGYILCDKKGRCPTTEKRAHIIPHAAGNLSETAQLLDRVAGMSMRSGRDMARYLASARNVFYLSSCFEECFDNGTLVLVKVGPPELQCYRVTSTTRTEVTFGKDLQMRDLLSPTQAPVLLSCIDGLVVNLGRPAKLRSDKGTFNIPRVSHRFLDLHARAHGRQLQDAPLVAHKHALSARALAHAPERYAEGLTATTIIGCEPPLGATSPLF